MKGQPYEPSDLKRALRLKETMTWPEVAADFPGRSWKSLQISASKYKKGIFQPSGKHKRGREHNLICEKMVSDGVKTLKPVAEKLGVTVQTAHRRMMLLGLDAEMRRLG